MQAFFSHEPILPICHTPFSPHPTAITFVACSRIAFPLHAFAAAVSAVPRVFLHLLAAVDATAQLSTASHRMRQDAQPCLCPCQRRIRSHLPRGPLGFRDSRNKSHTCTVLPTHHTPDVSHASHAVSSLSSRSQLSHLVCAHVTPPLCLLSVCSPHSSFWSLLIAFWGLGDSQAPTFGGSTACARCGRVIRG